MGIGSRRNEKCWCGSGFKYKRCHYMRENDQPVKTHDLIVASKKMHSERLCYHPEAPNKCSDSIINAHTVQKSGGLSKIARNGHVYIYNPSLKATFQFNGQSTLRLIGINKASTFTGFCAYHDSDTFKNLETLPFSSTNEQSFLLAYRAICKAIYSKKYQLKMIDCARFTDKGKPPSHQFQIQDYLNLLKLGAEAGLADLDNFKSQYDKNLLVKKYSNIKYLTIEIDKPPEILCSGFILPEYDFDGKLLQDLGEINDRLEGLSFSSIAKQDGGAFIFSWLNDSKNCSDFCESLLTKQLGTIPHYLLRFIFEYFENICISPDWWDGLSDHSKSTLLERFNKSLQEDTQEDCLKEDGVRAVDWTVTNIRKNY